MDKIYTIEPPYGIENFKLIATKEPIDLRQIVSSRGANDGVKNPLEKLVQRSYVSKTRGIGDEEEEVVLPPDVAHVYTLLFRIK